MIDCGGCQGLGAHRRYCPRHPDYHPWRQLADRADSIADTIGGNDPGLANRAYQLGAMIREAMPQHPWRPLPVEDTPGAGVGPAPGVSEP